MNLKRLQFSTLAGISRSILFVAVVLALAVVVADVIRERARDGAPRPGTERTQPSSYYFIDARV
jgi:hypothetical protein